MLGQQSHHGARIELNDISLALSLIPKQNETAFGWDVNPLLAMTRPPFARYVILYNLSPT